MDDIEISSAGRTGAKAVALDVFGIMLDICTGHKMDRVELNQANIALIIGRVMMKFGQFTPSGVRQIVGPGIQSSINSKKRKRK